MTKKTTKESFIEKARKVHGDKYDYSKVEYKNNKIPIEIICPIHGVFKQRGDSHTRGCGCIKCKWDNQGDNTRLNNSIFSERANVIHNGKYDYSKVCYIDYYTKVLINCPIHGDFIQRPSNHISNKSGCPICKSEKYKSIIFNFGINDILGIVHGRKFYEIWFRMIERCYDKKCHKKHPTYIGCTVCDEWKYLSNFEKWFNENYIDGYAIDKDVLFKMNKVYSPETCCFVPQQINSLFTKRENKRNNLPIGVYSISNKIHSSVSRYGKSHLLGVFDTKEGAFAAYKEAKESYIKEMANRWKDNIAPNVYEAMMKYEVEITD